ncbi:hypothetical protein O6H91_06G027600 [Diphasiastrum complanatum]|uniref:Uncharacterized protein n=1 Tax=Diphasiastrum complanatum TaxID=34168 RepID=A0ACC2DCA7_DIPCM|nr:hypothetical protein O6H91_06G027600 [Diphasiastrum complanatum]
MPRSIYRENTKPTASPWPSAAIFLQFQTCQYCDRLSTTSLHTFWSCVRSNRSVSDLYAAYRLSAALHYLLHVAIWVRLSATTLSGSASPRWSPLRPVCKLPLFTELLILPTICDKVWLITCSLI